MRGIGGLKAVKLGSLHSQQRRRFTEEVKSHLMVKLGQRLPGDAAAERESRLLDPVTVERQLRAPARHTVHKKR